MKNMYRSTFDKHYEEPCICSSDFYTKKDNNNEANKQFGLTITQSSHYNFTCTFKMFYIDLMANIKLYEELNKIILV